MQRFYRWYKDETGVGEVDMHDFLPWAIAHGWPEPKPVDPRERLMREFSDPLRQETRIDKKTHRTYRANHAITELRNGRQQTSWLDIDENPPRHRMEKSFAQRREQMVGEAYTLTKDCDHWNSENSDQEPIQMNLDFNFDVQLRKLQTGEMYEEVH